MGTRGWHFLAFCVTRWAIPNAIPKLCIDIPFRGWSNNSSYERRLQEPQMGFEPAYSTLHYEMKAVGIGEFMNHRSWIHQVMPCVVTKNQTASSSCGFQYKIQLHNIYKIESQ